MPLTQSKTIQQCYLNVISAIILPLFCIGGAFGASAQNGLPETNALIVQQEGLFDSEEVIEITLHGAMKKLLKDKSKKPKNYPLVLSYQDELNMSIDIPVDVKTRGNFRRLYGKCDYLPLRIEFSKGKKQQQSIFKDQHKLKLVMPCRDEKYVVREWLVYKLYNLLTPYSFKARLVKVKIENTESNKEVQSVYGILLEEEEQMARRNEMIAVELSLRPNDLQYDSFLDMAVFQFLIGNTDWGVKYLQNIKLLALDRRTLPHPVPYDFDHAGIVDAPYAKPTKQLRMKNVRQRRYRGYCIENLRDFKGTLYRFNDIKEEVYKVYTECELLEPDYIQTTLKYLNEFYSIINDELLWQKEFSYPCDPDGTGKVVIKGLGGKIK